MLLSRGKSVAAQAVQEPEEMDEKATPEDMGVKFD